MRTCTHVHTRYFFYKNETLASPKLQFKAKWALFNYLVVGFPLGKGAREYLAEKHIEVELPW